MVELRIPSNVVTLSLYKVSQAQIRSNVIHPAFVIFSGYDYDLWIYRGNVFAVGKMSAIQLLGRHLGTSASSIRFATTNITIYASNKVANRIGQTDSIWSGTY